jgi:hypothetical protein
LEAETTRRAPAIAGGVCRQPTSRFTVITESEIEELEDGVNEHLALGWRLHSATFINTFDDGLVLYFQPMVKDD